MRSVLAVVILGVALSAQAATAYFLRQTMGQTVTGQTAVICTYSYNGQEFSRAYPIGTMCPLSVEVY